MGNLPDPARRVPLDVQIESREETPDYVRIKLTYAPSRETACRRFARAEGGRAGGGGWDWRLRCLNRDQWSRLWE
jgi:hypothetical protein